MSNIAGKAYAMNVITPSRPHRTWLNQFIFNLGRVTPATLGGLLGLSIIHFARWVIVKRDQWPDGKGGRIKQNIDNDYMIFCSNFNGTWDQYIDAFSDGIPNGLDLFWYTATKYPGSIPITSFKDYITHNQIYTDYYYNATPGAAQRDIKSGMKVAQAIRDLSDRYQRTKASLEHAKTPEARAKLLAQFRESYEQQLIQIQNNLPEQGYAPVASLDTEQADINRKSYLNELYPKNQGARNAKF